MREEGYGKYIANFVDKIEYDKPIYTELVAENVSYQYNINIKKAKEITNVNLKRIADKGKLERFQKGIYYKAKQTPFGKKGINPDTIAFDVLVKRGHDVIGYETGPALLNKVGLTTQIPRNYHIATNIYKNKPLYAKNIVVKKPIIEVKSDNYKYLQVLDIISDLDKFPVDAENPEQIIKNYIKVNNISNEKLILLARKYCSTKVLLKTIDITLGE